MTPTSCAPCELALQHAAERARAVSEAAQLRERLASLTPREREVMDQLSAGQLNEQIAGDLGRRRAAPSECHRARVIEKMGVESLASCAEWPGDRMMSNQ